MTLQKFWDSEGYVFKKGKIQLPSKHKWNLTPKDVFSAWCAEADDDIMSFKDFDEKLLEICGDSSTTGTHQIKTADDAQDLIENCCKEENIVFDTRGSVISQRGTVISYADWENLVLRYNDRYTEDTPKDTRRTYGTDVIKREMKYYLHNLDMRQRNKLKEEMEKYDPECEEYTNEMLLWVVRSFDISGDCDFNVAMLKHWMWQTKRYVIGQNVMSPMFCNFFGEAQETGKTKFIENLTRPFKDYRVGISLSDMLDDRRSEAWTKNYVAVADELKLGDIGGKQLGQVIAVIKNYLTAETIEYRELGSHRFVKARRTFSPIASSNKSIVDIIFDETGMRRFYEFRILAKSNRKTAKLRVGGFIDMDVDALWRGIDPNLEEGYVTRHNDFGDMLSEIQNSYKHNDYVDIFLEDEDSFFYNLLKITDKSATLITEAVQTVGASKYHSKNYAIYDVMIFTKEVKTWIKDIDPTAEKFIPSPMMMPAKLRKKGYLIIEHRNKSYVVVQNVSN